MEWSRVLITGCGGMLGSAVVPYFRERCGEVLATDRDAREESLEPLDVRDARRVAERCRDFRPDLVLHLAAETDLEYCELNRRVAKQTNVDGTRIVAECAEAIGATLVYVSTAGVFDGEKEGAYTEDDEPRPQMVYGETKLAGEVWAREICDRTYVVRAGWMVGGGRSRDKKFVRKVLEQIDAGAERIHAVGDKWGTPTYTHDFAMNLFFLLRRGVYGTYHMVCEGSGTRYDVAREIVAICGRTSELEVIPVTSDFFAEEYFAFRPRSEMMINLRLKSLGIDLMRPWNVALRDYIRTEFPALCRNGLRLGQVA
jgi:dTDP-4-dehydrorhamnose reductase